MKIGKQRLVGIAQQYRVTETSVEIFDEEDLGHGFLFLWCHLHHEKLSTVASLQVFLYFMIHFFSFYGNFPFVSYNLIP